MPFMTLPVAIALAGTAGASAGASIYANRKAGSVNEKSIAAQRAAEAEAATIERERQARAESMYKAAQEADERRWQQYMQAYGNWQSTLPSLLDLARGRGGGRAALPAMSPTPQPAPAAGSTAGAVTGVTEPRARTMPYAATPVEVGAAVAPTSSVASRGRALATR